MPVMITSTFHSISCMTFHCCLKQKTPFPLKTFGYLYMGQHVMHFSKKII